MGRGSDLKIKSYPTQDNDDKTECYNPSGHENCWADAVASLIPKIGTQATVAGPLNILNN